MLRRTASGLGLGSLLRVGSQLLAEEGTEDQTGQRTAVEQLPQQGHGQIQPKVCTQVPKLGSLKSRVAMRLMTGHMMQTIMREVA